MGWYIRKSKSIGPIRINLSKSGIGASLGVKGARISVGPKGTYFNAGSNGLYYREKLGGKAKNSTFKGINRNSVSGSMSNAIINYFKEQVAGEEYNSAPQAVHNNTDIISKKIGHALRLPFILKLFCASFLLLSFFYKGDSEAVSPLAFTGFLLTAIAIFVVPVFQRISLEYQMDTTQELEWNDFCSAISLVEDSDAVYMFSPFTTDAVYSSSYSVRRVKEIPPNSRSALFTKSNTNSIQLISKKQKCVFLPDRILVASKMGRVTSILFDSITATQDYSLIDGNTINLTDARIHSVHWKHETKYGQPDLRYKDNPRKIIYRLEAIEFNDGNNSLGFSVSRRTLVDVIISKAKSYFSNFENLLKETDENDSDSLDDAILKIQEVLNKYNSTTDSSPTKTHNDTASKGASVFNSTSPFEEYVNHNDEFIEDFSQMESLENELDEPSFDSNKDSMSTSNYFSEYYSELIPEEQSDNEQPQNESFSDYFYEEQDDDHLVTPNKNETEKTANESDLIDDIFKFFEEE